VLRRRLFRAAWALAWPVRTYLRLTPAHRGRGLVEAALVRLVMPLAPSTFVTSLPGGGTIALRYRERIGLSTLVYGSFEAAETQFLRRLARPGTTAFDAGANVGLFTVPLALAVGSQGRVLAFEPAPGTVARLRENLRRNGLENVSVVEAALGAKRGSATLVLEADSAYNSTAPTPTAAAGGAEVRVERLDDVWVEAGRPEVSVLKVDVEGAEVEVLAGAAELLRSGRPAVLVEASEPSRAAAISRLCAEQGYRLTPASGFQPWNLLFLPMEMHTAAP
jgi:FkbM family methyltransferase